MWTCVGLRGRCILLTWIRAGEDVRLLHMALPGESCEMIVLVGCMEGSALLRILQVIGAMDRGGAETMIMNLYRAVDRSEVQFDFLVHETRECDYDQEIEQLGGKIFRLPRFTGVNLVRYRSLCRAFFSAHPEIAIVHGHIGSSAAIYLAEAKRAGKVSIAHSHAQNFLLGPSGWAFRLASYPTRYVADYFMACSHEAGIDRFGLRVVEGDRFMVLNNGIDLTRYRCDESRHQAAKRALDVTGRPVFGHVGRLAEEKNHRFLFQAFTGVREHLPDAVLLLAGRGPLEQELKECANDLGIANAVRFLGVRDDVPVLLRAMDVFVFPSIKEGLPVAAIEAQASGLPCLISTGVPEHANASLLCERMSLEEGAENWADKMIEMYRLSQQTSRTDKVDEVRAGGFDIADSARVLTDTYRSLLSR